MERISHYEIVRRLGQGGMGEVFEATDLDLGRRVAIKFIAAHYAGDPEALLRFEREARTAAALHHPRIATLFAFDRGTERAFIVMELLGGRTLREVLARGPLPVADALAITRDVADALAYAHRRGVVHRDIKPENLMFDVDGAIKITDFGLARLAEASQLTVAGSALGTPAYMAPERVHGARPGEARTEAGAAAPADVFALGVTLHEMLAGSPPFRGDNALSTLYAIAHADAPPLRGLRADVPPGVEALVARMLEKDPGRRPSAAAVASELAEFAGVTPSISGAASGPGTGFAAGGMTTSAVTLPVERLPAAHPTAALAVPGAIRTGRGRRGRAVMAIALAALAIVAIAWGIGARQHRPDPRAVALNNEGHDSLAHGRLEPARTRFEAALAIAPRYAEAKLNLATALGRRGDVDRAATLYGDVLRENPRRPELLAAAHYGLGELDLQAHAWPSAIAHLGAAARGDSSRVEYPNNLAFALIQAGRTTEALATLRAAESRFPGTPALLKNAALAWFAGGQPDSALAAANRCVRLDPSLASAWLVKLECEAARGDRAAALASLDALRRLQPDQALLAEAAAALRAAPSGRAANHP